MLRCEIYHSLLKVLPENKPTQALRSATVLLNERFNFLAYLSCNEDRKVSLSIRGINVPYLIRRLEKRPLTQCVKDTTDDYVLSDKDGDYYDILYPCDKESISLRTDENNAFLISLCGDKENFPAEELNVEVCVSDGREKTTASFALSVIDCALPKSDIFVTNWIQYDCIANTHGVEPFSVEFYGYLDKYLQAYVEHGNNMLLTPLFTPPLDTKPGTYRLTTQLVDVAFDGADYRFNFDKLDYFLDFVRQRGIEYIEFSHLFSQWGAEFCPKVMVEENGKIDNKFGWDIKSDSEEYLAFLGAFLPQLVSFIARKGIKDKCYFHLSDEPNSEHIERYRKLSAIVHPYLDGCPVMDALSDYELAQDNTVDMPVVAIEKSAKFIEVKHRHAAYNCCYPRSDYYTNRFIHFPAERMRVLGALLYYNDAVGYLHWGYNFYNARFSVGAIDPYLTADADGQWPAGDPFIVYPTADGCIDSIRHETFLESMQDFRSLCALEKLSNRQYVLQLFEGYEIKGYNRYPRRAEWLVQFRNTVNEEIRKLLAK